MSERDEKLSGLSALRRFRLWFGRAIRLFLWPLDRILAPHCGGNVFPPSAAAVFMQYDGPAPAINQLPAGLRVSKMRVRDFWAWFGLLRKSELVWSFCLDGIAKFLLDRRFARYPTFMVWRGTQLLASASLWDENRDGKKAPLVHMVAVDPAARGMGLGTYVTCLVMAHLRNDLSVSDSIRLQVSGIPAQRFYEKIGFYVISD